MATRACLLTAVCLSLGSISPAASKDGFDGMTIIVEGILVERAWSDVFRNQSGPPSYGSSKSYREAKVIPFFAGGTVASIQTTPSPVCHGSDGSLSNTAIIYDLKKPRKGSSRCQPHAYQGALGRSVTSDQASYASRAASRGDTLEFVGSAKIVQNYRTADSLKVENWNINETIVLSVSGNTCRVVRISASASMKSVSSGTTAGWTGNDRYELKSDSSTTCRIMRG
jgi:hypothetical protein